MAASKRELPSNLGPDPPAPRPWFAAAELPAVRDFLRVYDQHLEEIERTLAAVAEVRGILREAAERGDFHPYEALLARRGAQGQRPRDGLARVLADHLVRAHARAPERLAAALGAMGEFLVRQSEASAEGAQLAREVAWRRSEHSLAITLESIGDAVIATDERGRIERMNPVAQQLSGWRLEEARGRRLEEIFRVVDEDTGRTISYRIEEVLNGGAMGLPTHAALVARDGRHRSIADSVAPIRDDEGDIHGVVVVFIDQTKEREHEQALRSLAEWVESSREEERTRIARELHDELGQQLTAIRMDLGWIGLRLRDVPSAVRERLEAMGQLLDSLVDTVRRIGTELRPGLLDDLGLAEAIEWQAIEFERRSGIRVEVDTSNEIGMLGRSESTAIFRIFQEILTNVARHAGARRVVGQLSIQDDRVTLTVRDDGRGIRPEEVSSPRSLGLLGMRERAVLHGGIFRIEAAKGGGTVVSVTLPWTEATRS